MAQNKPQIQYLLSFSKPEHHFYDVELIVRFGLKTSRLVFPSWTPGSYLIRDYIKHLQNFKVTTLKGQSLKNKKVRKDCYEIANGGKDFKITYRLYANELTVRSNHFDDTHAFVCPAGTFFYLEGHQDSGYQVTLVPPAGWKVFTGLPRVKGSAHTYGAVDFDTLMDSPLECAPAVMRTFRQKKKLHRVVFSGKVDFDLDKVVADIRKITHTAGKVIGELPVKDYTFLNHMEENAFGGLEHLNSCANHYPPFGRKDVKAYESFLSLTSHEYFHLWHVKRIRPQVLGPFDYTQPNYTRELWAMEGFTSYYDKFILRRAGLISQERYLEMLCESMVLLYQNPGRAAHTLEESSFDAWIKLYQPEQNNINSTTSYYLKGSLLALLTDISLRDESNGKVCMDNVLRELWKRYTKTGKGFPEGEYEKTILKYGGKQTRDLIRMGLRTSRELPYDKIFGKVGLLLKDETVYQRTGISGKKVMKGWLGLNLKSKTNSAVVSSVLCNTGAWDAGLQQDDELVAVGTTRVDAQNFKQIEASFLPGEKVSVSYFRRDVLHEVQVEAGKPWPQKLKLVQDLKATPRSKRIQENWLR